MLNLVWPVDAYVSLPKRAYHQALPWASITVGLCLYTDEPLPGQGQVGVAWKSFLYSLAHQTGMLLKFQFLGWSSPLTRVFSGSGAGADNGPGRHAGVPGSSETVANYHSPVLP